MGIRKWIQEKAAKKFEQGNNAYLFYRCNSCNTAFPIGDMLKVGVCPKCGTSKFSPTNLSKWGEIKMLFRVFF